MSINFPLDKEVCTCAHINLEQLQEVIITKGLKTLGQIQDSTKAGTFCRNCICQEVDISKMQKDIYLKDILKSING